jgi:rod shape-determining protein MreD
MKELIIAAMIALGFFLQTGLLPFLEIRGIKPDLLLVMLVGMGYCGGNPLGLIAGLCAGVLIDVIYGQAFGLNALIYMLIGFGAGIFYNKNIFGKHFLPLILTAGACLMKNIILYIYLFFEQTEVNPGAFWGQIVFSEMLYSLLLAYPIYFLMNWLFKKKVMDRRIRGNWFEF